tara:strand:- start:6610 stop:7785 length:1176 start_codon:yes stop_codon:yes gene_type:complete
MNTTFNLKTKQRKGKVNNNTLDYVHSKKIESINNKKKKLGDLKKKYSDLNKTYNTLCKKKKPTDADIEKKININDQLTDIKNNIDYIENNHEEHEYLLNVGDILFEYYDNDDLETNNNTKKNTKNKTTNNDLISFFNKKQTNTTDNILSKKGKLLDDYLNIIDTNYHQKNVNFVKENICSKCNGEVIINYIEGISICVACGEQEFILIDSDKPNYKEPSYESNYFAYKRINHFNEWLSQFQAKESTDIPNDIIEKIMVELKKERIFNVANISNNKIREILKKIKLNKFYEHIPYIINKINGKPPPNISKHLEEKLRYMFKEIQNPFQKHCPKHRKNFLSYSYVIHKFIQLLGIDEYLVYFPLLKSREKLYQQDKIWKEICNDLGWQYINSI